jgi:hypothetical protein
MVSSLQLFLQNYLGISHHFHVYYMFQHPRPFRFVHPYNIWWRELLKMLLITQIVHRSVTSSLLGSNNLHNKSFLTPSKHKAYEILKSSRQWRFTLWFSRLRHCAIQKAVTIVTEELSTFVFRVNGDSIVTYYGVAWLIKRGFDLMIDFIWPLYDLLQHFTNQYLRLDALDFWQHYSSKWTELSVIAGFSLYSLGSDHSTENTSID